MLQKIGIESIVRLKEKVLEKMREEMRAKRVARQF